MSGEALIHRVATGGFIAVIKSLFCFASAHVVNRRRVWHDGRNFRTRCQRCREPLIRDKGNWRIFDIERDGSDVRHSHPHTGEAA